MDTHTLSSASMPIPTSGHLEWLDNSTDLCFKIYFYLHYIYFHNFHTIFGTWPVNVFLVNQLSNKQIVYSICYYTIVPSLE